MSAAKEISLRIEGYIVTIALPNVVAGGIVMPDSNWLPFSPTEQSVLRLLLDEGPLSRDEIASKLGESPDGRIKGIMATLVARRVVLVTPEGYRLNCTDESRPRVAELLSHYEVPSGDAGRTE